MTGPTIGVKYRIQNVDFLTYIEALDQGTPDVKLRPAKESDFQYWQFEKVTSNTDFYYVRNVGNNARCLCCDGTNISANTASTSNSMAGVSFENGSYRLTVRYNSKDYYVDPDQLGASVMGSTKNDTNKQRWRLIPVASQPIPLYPVLQNGNYRIRNLNGDSLLTLPDAKSFGGSTSLYVRTQLGDKDKLKYYQRWIITQQDSGGYTIQNAGDNSYLGCTILAPIAGDKVVGLQDVLYSWNIQSIGGFAWSIQLPTGGLSVGVVDNNIQDEDEMSLVTSDNTSSQIWFMEKYIPLGNDVIYAKREVAEGTYLLQSCHDSTIYMKANSTPWRITPATAAPSKFKLKYVDDTSAHFTLTYTTAATSKVVYNAGGYIGLNDDGDELVLLEKDKGDPGYVICLPDHGYPHKVVSNRTKADGNGNDVFAIDNKVTGEALQMWNLVSSS